MKFPDSIYLIWLETEGCWEDQFFWTKEEAFNFAYSRYSEFEILKYVLKYKPASTPRKIST